MESFAFPAKINSISTEILRKCSKLCNTLCIYIRSICWSSTETQLIGAALQPGGSQRQETTTAKLLPPPPLFATPSYLSDPENDSLIGVGFHFKGDRSDVSEGRRLGDGYPHVAVAIERRLTQVCTWKKAIFCFKFRTSLMRQVRYWPCGKNKGKSCFGICWDKLLFIKFKM